MILTVPVWHSEVPIPSGWSRPTIARHDVNVGLFDRLDALDARFGFKRPLRPAKGRRGPWTIIGMFVPLWLEFQGVVSTVVRDYPHGIPAVLAVFGMVAGLMGVVILVWTPRAWAPRLLLLIQTVVAIRVVYRGVVEGPTVRLLWLVAVAVFVALLLAPSSRDFYRGEWRPRRRA
jgi:hypothetical protein